MLWLAIHLPALPLQVFTRGMHVPLPLAVLTAAPGTTILAASPRAKAAGVHCGQRSASALALLPELQLKTRDPEREADALAEIATWAGRFSPRISLSPPDAVLLEISACLRLFGGAARIEHALRAGLAELGFDARTACAPTPLAARWFARAGASADAESRPPAQAGNELSDASATAAAPAEAAPGASPDWLTTLDGLALDLLGDSGGDGCDAHTLELLAGLGLRTLGEVRRLPAAGLARRQAQAASRTLARARGELADPRPWFEPPPRFDHSLVLPVATHHADALLFAARRLLTSLAAWLQARHAAVDLCTLVLEHASPPHTTLDLVFGEPSQDEARFTLIARERLAAVALGAEVSGLRVVAEQPVLAQPHSADLFGDPAASKDGALLLARLQARLGHKGVYRLSAQADHRPEAAWMACEASAASLPRGGRGGQRGQTDQTSPIVAERLRPLWLLPTPKPVSGARFMLLGEAERIETGWWDGHVVRRDYYLARDEHQALCWIFHTLDTPEQWFVHGYFG
jgi:protein ImuB